jgi:hypothetical protein
MMIAIMAGLLSIMLDVFSREKPIIVRGEKNSVYIICPKCGVVTMAIGDDKNPILRCYSTNAKI